MDLPSLLSFLGPSFDLPRFLLILVRVTSLFVIAPVLGNTTVPVRFRVGLAVLVSFFMLPATAPVALPDAGTVFLAVLKEIAVGLLIGFFAQLVFYGVQLAGQMVAQQMGFGLDRIFDPNTHTQVTGVGQLYYFTALLTFLAMDGHHLLLMALARSFRQVTLGAFVLAPLQVDRLIAGTNEMFVTAFILMLPTLGILLLVEISLAIATRVMPQLNAFVMGFPIKIMLGMATLMLTLPLLSTTFENLTGTMFGQLFRFFSH